MKGQGGKFPSNIFDIRDGFGYFKVGNNPEIKVTIEQLEIIKQYRWRCTDGRLPDLSGQKPLLSIARVLYPDIKELKYKDGNRYNLTPGNIEEQHRECYVKDNICYIPLSNGQTAICDAIYFDKVRQYQWYLNPKGLPVGKNYKLGGISLMQIMFGERIIAIYKDGNKLNYISNNVSKFCQKKEIINDICYIYMSTAIAICSASDYDKIKNYTWVVNKRGYPMVKTKGKSIEMHKMITQYSICDHINRDKLDNRQCNLRGATFAENLFNKPKYKNNTSGHKGVHKKHNNKYGAVIGYRCKQIHIGYYPTKEEAARAYDKKAKELYGAFASLNFPEE